jgi:hypothetical protein
MRSRVELGKPVHETVERIFPKPRPSLQAEEALGLTDKFGLRLSINGRRVASMAALGPWTLKPDTH